MTRVTPSPFAAGLLRLRRVGMTCATCVARSRPIAIFRRMTLALGVIWRQSSQAATRYGRRRGRSRRRREDSAQRAVAV